MAKAAKDINYIRWQNRSFWFYLAARTCGNKEFYAPAAFLSQQCVEQLVKATLIWWEPSFDPKKHGGHDLYKMEKMIREKVPDQAKFTIPDYLCDGKYQSLSRYPADGWGLGVPSTLIPDVDWCFAALIEMVPFQCGSELFWTLLYTDPRIVPKKRRDTKNHYEELARDNGQMERLYNHVVVRGNPRQMERLRRRQSGENARESDRKTS